MYTQTNPTGEPRCICGAMLDQDGPTLCRKCTARVRYRRRRDRRHTDPGTGDLG